MLNVSSEFLGRVGPGHDGGRVSNMVCISL